MKFFNNWPITFNVNRSFSQSSSFSIPFLVRLIFFGIHSLEKCLIFFSHCIHLKLSEIVCVLLIILVWSFHIRLFGSRYISFILFLFCILLFYDFKFIFFIDVLHFFGYSFWLICLLLLLCCLCEDWLYEITNLPNSFLFIIWLEYCIFIIIPLISLYWPKP